LNLRNIAVRTELPEEDFEAKLRWTQRKAVAAIAAPPKKR
jgi:hypothetical protein